MLGVYVTCKDEENLIVPCVSALQKVFPQVEVIDLGSTDSTIDRLKPLGCTVHIRHCSPQAYPKLKNEFANKHEWVFWVDGDEIYPPENLALVHKFIASKNYHAYRMSWKYLQVKNKQLMASEHIINGTKLYRPKRYQYRRAWPKEVLDGPGSSDRQEPPQLNGLWCWHGKLLKRSRNHDFLREEKRQFYRNGGMEQYHGNVSWTKIDAFPWENPQAALWEEQ